MLRKSALLVLIGVLALSGCASVQQHGLYVEGGVSMLLERDPPEVTTVLVATPAVYADGSTRYTIEPKGIVARRVNDISEVRNPYGNGGVGYDWEWKRTTLDYKIYEHRSSLLAGDHGDNWTGLFVKYYLTGHR